MDPFAAGPWNDGDARPGAFNYSPQSTTQCQIQPSEGGDRKADREVTLISIDAISEQVSY
jgi:hypothetical protein